MTKKEPANIFTGLHLDKQLRQQILGLLNEQWVQRNHTYKGMGDFIRQALNGYRNGILNPVIKKWDSQQRTPVAIKFTATEKSFYHSLPHNQKYHYLNSILEKQLQLEEFS